MTDNMDKRSELNEDIIWAEGLVNKIKNDPRSFVKYRDSRPITSIRDMIDSSCRLFSKNTAFFTKQNGGDYEPITYEEFYSDIRALFTAVVNMGLSKERFAIIGDTNYTWSVADMAVVCGAGVAVPLDRELPYDDLKNLITQSGAKAVFTDKKRENHFLRMIKDGGTNLEFVISQTEKEDRTLYVGAEGKVCSADDPDAFAVTVLSQQMLIEKGKQLVHAGDTRWDEVKIDAKELAVILFTSGTTGLAKGIMLSNRNFCCNLMCAPTVLQVKSTDVFYSVLPIHHTYEYTCNFLMPLYKGAAIAHCRGLRYLAQDMKDARPTMFLAVPAILEALDHQLWKGLRKKGLEEKAKKGLKFSAFCRNAFKFDVSDMFFGAVKATFGGRLRMIISGGAAIDPKILMEFQAFGIQAVQGYGLSECAPLGALNPDTAPVASSAGVAFPACSAMIYNPDENGIGEICLRGDNIMLGYYNMPELTAQAVVDGWFHTGDLGRIDRKGYIYITGRSKNVIITKNGKNVFPEELEYQLGLNPEILESMCFEATGRDGDDTIIAVSVYPDWELITDKLGDDANDNEKVEAYLWTLIDAVNEVNPGYKNIKKLMLRHSPLEKNTSNKVIRFIDGNKEAN